ncbi:MAG: hypothetical protein NOF05_10915 [Candidatus Accumulibacter phosphatis]|uniref:Uncharacterized protein n=2 Tax=Candidatus Accumulibacter TaxID=327159 RepID=A0A080MAP0_9PROT|nr:MULTISPECIES: hypothetical protein [Candidatus Accumulibacter]KFB78377.1 MAG: hypothetical protein AW06_000329 [Candidatus Accumulibacter cognatus]MBN8516689.1 hypothetical protein [Accumulibacter sp.]MBO3713204.1 hypothetical protein [Accumulibacter sp.]MCC2868538.1 hypothetical protein [Candidatus Accumulibacter phosphatis]MCM8580509.1 hypothetical protein [Accumulibacter sp.]
MLCGALALAGWAPVGAWLAERVDVPSFRQAEEFKRAAALEPVAAALDFLNRLATASPPIRVRLPVSIALDEYRLSIVDARLGPSGAAAATRLQLDDGKMGVALADRARDLCAAGRRCVVRLIGYWRGTVDDVGHLDVRRIDGLVPDAAAAAVEVESR